MSNACTGVTRDTPSPTGPYEIWEEGEDWPTASFRPPCGRMGMVTMQAGDINIQLDRATALDLAAFLSKCYPTP